MAADRDAREDPSRNRERGRVDAPGDEDAEQEGHARILALPLRINPRFKDVMGRAGIEPATFGLKVRCSTN